MIFRSELPSCRYNGGVECATPDVHNCAVSGWNPSVKANRIRELRADLKVQW